MKNESVWYAVPRGRYAAVRKAADYDVIVIGAGITGLTAAYLLKQAGKKVCVLERDRIGAVDTGHTTAHLTYVTDLRLSQLAKTFGESAARAVWQAGATAIDTIEGIAEENQIACDFRRVPGFLHASIDSPKGESRKLEDDTNLARSLGFDATFLSSVPYFAEPGIRFSNQALFHPLKYLAALAKQIHGDGSTIHEQSEVSEVTDDPRGVTVAGHKLSCNYLVIATHVPLAGNAGMMGATLFQAKLAPYSSYVVGAKVKRNLLPEASFWDTSEPYYYLRVERGPKSDYVIFGGEDHKTGQVSDTDECFARLENMLLGIVPSAVIDRRWSGQVIETNDGLPFIGETAEGQFAATGYSGNGMTFGTLAGLMARDAVLGQENPWSELFSPRRKKLRGGTWNFIKENFDYPYYWAKDRLTSADGESTREVKRGEGKILKLDGQRVACSRDDAGKLLTVSAVCTHMGCLVRWNGAERTWDCPCHGSRFHPNGDVIAGPAEEPLAKVPGKSAAPKTPAKPTAKQATAKKAAAARTSPTKKKQSPKGSSKK